MKTTNKITSKKIIIQEEYPDVNIHIVNSRGREVFATIPRMKSQLNVGQIYAARARFGHQLSEVMGKVENVQHHPEEGFITVDVMLELKFDNDIYALIAAGWEEVLERS
jgi:hypothetical protein